MGRRTTGRLLTLAAALLRAPLLHLRRPAHPPRRILIAHALLMGDTLMLTPLLAKLRAQYPQTELVMTVSPFLQPLYAGQPYGIRTINFDRRDAGSVRHLLRAGPFDLALVPGDNRYAWLARAMGARRIRAFRSHKASMCDWMVDEFRDYPDTPGAWGDMMTTVIDGPEPPPYTITDWTPPPRPAFESPSPPYIVLHVGASKPIKLWARERWQALAERLTNEGIGVIWSGGSGEQALIDAVDPDHRYPAFVGRGLDAVWHLIADADALVCPDTGIAHLGRLCGTPTLALFGQGNPDIFGGGRFWSQSRFRALYVRDLDCRDDHHLFDRELAWVTRCQRDLRDCADPVCMRHLDFDSVWAALQALRSPIQ